MTMLTVALLLAAMLALTGATPLPGVAMEHPVEQPTEDPAELPIEDPAELPAEQLMIPEAKSRLVKRSPCCSGGWSEFNGRCFRYIPRPMTWAKAEKNCQSLRGNLASVHDITEYHQLQRLILSATQVYKVTWIGGSDAQEENVFLWSDGKPFHYTNWCPGEPNNQRISQHCIQMNFGDSKCWDDVRCGARRPSVCAKSP